MSGMKQLSLLQFMKPKAAPSQPQSQSQRLEGPTQNFAIAGPPLSQDVQPSPAPTKLPTASQATPPAPLVRIKSQTAIAARLSGSMPRPASQPPVGATGSTPNEKRKSQAGTPQPEATPAATPVKDDDAVSNTPSASSVSAKLTAGIRRSASNIARLTSTVGATVKTEGRQTVQTTLDFGQQSTFGTTCPRCGMLYSELKDDIKVHRRHCKRRREEKATIPLRVNTEVAAYPAVAHLPDGLPGVYGVRFAYVPDISVVVEKPMGAAVRVALENSTNLAAATVSAGQQSCAVLAFNCNDKTKNSFSVTDARKDLIGMILAEGKQRLFACPGSREPPVTMCDVHEIYVSRAAMRAKARTRASGGGGVEGMSDADKDLFGSILAPSVETFFAKPVRLTKGNVEEVGSHLTAAMLSILASHVVYGCRIAVPRQLSFPASLAPVSKYGPAGRGGHSSSEEDEPDVSTDGEDPTPAEGGDGVISRYETRCLAQIEGIDLAKLHVRDA